MSASAPCHTSEPHTGALRATGQAELADTRWVVIKKPEDLTYGQRSTIAALARLNSPLYRGYLMKEQLREIFKASPGYGSLCPTVKERHGQRFSRGPS